MAALGDCRERTVVEIGPGRGAITRELSRQAGMLIAVELDRELSAKLSASFSKDQSSVPAGEKSHAVKVENTDVLDFDFAAAAAERGEKLIAVGNLPYYITSPILLKLAENCAVLDRAVLMVQREVADRVAAQPGSRDYGLLSVTVQLHGSVEPLFTLPPSAFSPPPEVHSTVFRWKFASRFKELDLDRGSFLAFLRQAFALKRKTLANNLRAAGFTAHSISNGLTAAGIDVKARAEALPVESLACLWRSLKTEGAIP